jgi:hypothetical protein
LIWNRDSVAQLSLEYIIHQDEGRRTYISEPELVELSPEAAVV